MPNKSGTGQQSREPRSPRSKTKEYLLFLSTITLKPEAMFGDAEMVPKGETNIMMGTKTGTLRTRKSISFDQIIQSFKNIS